MANGNRDTVSGIVRAVDRINVVYTKNDVRILNGIDKYSQRKSCREDTSQKSEK